MLARLNLTSSSSSLPGLSTFPSSQPTLVNRKSQDRTLRFRRYLHPRWMGLRRCQHAARDLGIAGDEGAGVVVAVGDRMRNNSGRLATELASNRRHRSVGRANSVPKERMSCTVPTRTTLRSLFQRHSSNTSLLMGANPPGSQVRRPLKRTKQTLIRDSRWCQG
jgi:hypothetical protein